MCVCISCQDRINTHLVLKKKVLKYSTSKTFGTKKLTRDMLIKAKLIFIQSYKEKSATVMWHNYGIDYY